MSEQQKRGYLKALEKFTERLSETGKISAEGIENAFHRAVEYIGAASDLTRDELALVHQYLKRDLQTFADQYQREGEGFKRSPFYLALENTIWHQLAELTDKTQLEWQEVVDDLHHHGQYKAGEWVGLGHLICEQCGATETFYHPTKLPSCPRCDGETFIRKPLAP